MLTTTIRTADGKEVGTLVLKEKVFKSGKAGWFGVGKIEIEGVRYQVQSQLVAIGEPKKDPTVEEAISERRLGCLRSPLAAVFLVCYIAAFVMLLAPNGETWWVILLQGGIFCILLLAPWVFLGWRILSSADTNTQDGDTIDDFVLRGGHKK